MTQVRDLAGAHLGRRITVTTANTEATGVLQGFEHEGSIITNLTYGGIEHIPGATTTHLTIFPGQRVLAELGDEIVVHGHTSLGEAPARMGGRRHRDLWRNDGRETRVHEPRGC